MRPRRVIKPENSPDDVHSDFHRSPGDVGSETRRPPAFPYWHAVPSIPGSLGILLF